MLKSINNFNSYIKTCTKNNSKPDSKRKDTQNNSEPDSKNNTKKKDTKNTTKKEDTKNNTESDSADDIEWDINDTRASIRKNQ